MITPLYVALLSAAALFVPADNDAAKTSAAVAESPAAAIEQPAPVAAAVDAEATSAKPASATTDDSTLNPAVGAERWKLRYQFQDGQKLRYLTEQTMTLDATVVDKRRIDRSEMLQRRLFTVQSLNDDGSVSIAMQFEHVRMEKKVDDLEPLVFDSTMKPGEVPVMFQQVAHQLKGSATKYRLSTVGISQIAKSTPKTIVQTANKSVDKSETDKTTPLVETDSSESGVQQASIKGASLTEKQNQSDPGSFLATLPEAEVRVGDTWKETIKVMVRLNETVNIEVSILRTFRLESVENGIANISFQCSVQSPVKNAVVMTQLIQATPRGTVTFDIARGMMLSREMRYDETVFNAMGQNSLLTSVGKCTEQLVEDEPAQK